jgi:hypothetical protein
MEKLGYFRQRHLLDAVELYPKPLVFLSPNQIALIERGNDKHRITYAMRHNDSRCRPWNFVEPS